MTLTPDVLNLEENVIMDFNRRMDGSSGWSGGSRSRDSSTSLSKGDEREKVDELKAMIQTFAIGFQNFTAAAFATTSAVAVMGEEVKKVVATEGEDVEKVATKVDAIEEEVNATKKLLEKTKSRVERVEGAIQKHAKKIQQMEEEIATN